MKCELNERRGIDLFEHSKSFKFYFSKHNLDEVLKDYEID